MKACTNSDTRECCSLCDIPISHHRLIDGEQVFCCHGCQAVYQILSTKGALEDFHKNSLFQEAVKGGLISNPALLEQLRRQENEAEAEEWHKLYLEVGEMWCPSCAEVIRLIIGRERGVKRCVVDYATDLAAIEFSPRHTSKEHLFNKIRALGYQPYPLEGQEARRVSRSLYLRFGISAFCAMNLMMFSYPLYIEHLGGNTEGHGQLFAWLSLLTAIPLVTYCLWPLLRRLWGGLLIGWFGMEALVTVGVAAAFGLSLYEMSQGSTYVYFDSMSMIVFFVLLGKIIESRAKFSAKESLLRLTRAMPRRGRRQYPDGTYAFVLIKEVSPGDLLAAFTGERIVLDGVVVSGHGGCDESVMTGEAIPVVKRVGDEVLSGTVVTSGSVTYRVTHGIEETALKKIIDMVEQDIGTKSVYTRAVDPIVRWFVPVVMLLALGTALWVGINTDNISEAILRAVSILLISCPCAIGIAAPLAESHLMHGLAQQGAIVRNRSVLSSLGRETAYVFDKTGTVTEGKFRVVSGIERLSVEAKGRLKGLAQRSTHPVAAAISAALFIEPFPFDGVEEVIGRGMRARLGDQSFYLGSPRLMEEMEIPIETHKEKEAHDQLTTLVYYVDGNGCALEIALGDRIVGGIPEVLSALGSIKKILLSGDTPETVLWVAKVVGFNDWKGGCSPLEKRHYIDTLKKEGEIVLMIGDGINDAPALTAAHIGVSVVSAADMSIQVSDILLTTEKLAILPKIRQLAVKGRRVIQQNLFWAFFYNVVGVGVAVAGYLVPIFAAAAMILSSGMVIANAHRLKKCKR